jgi:pimeloyl-ACP methyl ester carboxylesterase
LAQGPQIIVGSSMGGWLALLAAKARPALVRALLLIAPAPDFTEDLLWPRLPDAARVAIINDGLWFAPSAYDAEPTPITRRMIEEARDHLLLRAPLAIACPIRILHGMRDPDVPWQHSVKLVETLNSDDIVLTLVKDGDHRLSREQDLARLEATLNEMRDCPGLKA